MIGGYVVFVVVERNQLTEIVSTVMVIGSRLKLLFVV